MIRTLTLKLLAIAALVAAGSTTSRAELIYALNGNNELLTFDSAAPTAIITRTAITNTGSDAILNIDFRPATGQLYGLSGNNDLYVIDPVTGAATFLGGIAITGGFDYAFDFNPTVDRIRVATDIGGNFRINQTANPPTLTTDTGLFYSDANSGTAPQVAGAGYTNNFPGATSTQLFYIDFNLDLLALSPNPNGGELIARGPLGLDVTGLMGFDISGLTGDAFAALSTDGATSAFYDINLGTGSAVSRGTIGTGETILDISATAVPEPSTYMLIAVGAIAFIVARRRATRTA